MNGRRVLLGVVLLTAAVALGMPNVELAHSAPSHCKLSDLKGQYIFAATGWGILPGTTPVPDPLPPKAIIEWIHFNGDGTLDSAGATRSLNGQIAQIPGGGTSSIYTVTDLTPPDGGCSGTITFTNGPSFDLFFGAKGDVIWMIQTNPNNVFQGTATKVSH
jgi:hypothetical protein